MHQRFLAIMYAGGELELMSDSYVKRAHSRRLKQVFTLIIIIARWKRIPIIRGATLLMPVIIEFRDKRNPDRAQNLHQKKNLLPRDITSGGSLNY